MEQSQIENKVKKIGNIGLCAILLVAMIFSIAPAHQVFAGANADEEIEALTNDPTSNSFDGYTVKISEGIDKNMENDIEDTDSAEQVTEKFVTVDNPEDALEFASPKDIEYIEPNYYFTLDDGGTEKYPDKPFPEGPPNDKGFGSWTIDEITSDKAFTLSQWNLEMVNASYAWQNDLRGQGVKVGIIDTGINVIGTDLNAANFVAGINYYKSTTGNSNTVDNSGHGTKVLSVIASQVNNEENIAGITDKVQYVPLKVSNGTTRLATGADVVKAIDYAQSKGIWVLNMSMGTYNAYKPLEDQVNYYAAHGGILVASAGNDNVTTPRYPAQYTNSVGAGGLNSSGKRWYSHATSASNINGAIDAMAPAAGVPLYTGSTGTGNSFGTAHLTALAISAKQKSGGKINIVEFKNLLKETCIQDEDYTDGEKNVYYGYGRIDFKEFLSSMTNENSSGQTPVLPYSITYKKNGGKFTATYPLTYQGTSKVTLPTSKIIKKTGHTFKGWYAYSNFTGGKKTSIAAGDKGNKTFYAKWTAKKYTLKFNVNNGKSIKKSKRSKSVTYGQRVGSIPVPKRSGYNFVGWFTKKKSGGTEYTKSKKYKTAKSITVYARWTKKKVAKFNANGGMRYDYAKAITKGKKIGKLPTAERTGYKFAGWYTKKKGGTKVTKTYKIKKNKNITLYAHWSKK